jgi:PleD family two-component response regulator
MSMAHALNLPSETVTVSLGGATVRPKEDASAESASLVQSADRALYAAKERGRDRLVMAEPAMASLDVVTA